MRRAKPDYPKGLTRDALRVAAEWLQGYEPAPGEVLPEGFQQVAEYLLYLERHAEFEDRTEELVKDAGCTPAYGRAGLVRYGKPIPKWEP